MLHTCLLDHENIVNTPYGYGSQDHKFDTCFLNSKKVLFKLENAQVIPQMADNINPQMMKRSPSQDAG